MSEDRSRSRTSFAKLRDDCDRVRERGFESADFQEWRAAVIALLRKTFGEEHVRVKEFLSLQFELRPEITEAFQRSLRNIRVVTADTDSNVTKIHIPSF